MQQLKLHIEFATVNSPKGYDTIAGACYAEQ